MANPPTLERQWVIRVKPERAWRWALAWERVRSELGLVSEQTTELRFRTAGNCRKHGDICIFVTLARPLAECQARDTDVVKSQVEIELPIVHVELTLCVHNEPGTPIGVFVRVHGLRASRRCTAELVRVSSS
jgi:hypothetical protein